MIKPAVKNNRRLQDRDTANSIIGAIRCKSGDPFCSASVSNEAHVRKMIMQALDRVRHEAAAGVPRGDEVARSNAEQLTRPVANPAQRPPGECRECGIWISCPACTGRATGGA